MTAHACSDDSACGTADPKAAASGVVPGFHVARSVDDVLRGWRLLYRAYREVDFIRPNPYRLHTVPEAIGDHTAVVIAQSGRRTVGTISAIGDTPLGLPLDSVFADELNDMRRRGRRPMEVGLLAEQPTRAHRSTRPFSIVFEMMRYTFYFALHQGATDFVCGIPPRRASLYQRTLGFRQVGEVKQYATVEGNPVALMAIPTAHVLAYHTRYRAAHCFVKNPLPANTFDKRYNFRDPGLGYDLLWDYLRYKQDQSSSATPGETLAA